MTKRRIRWDRIALIAIPLLVIVLLLLTRCGSNARNTEESSAGAVDAGNSLSGVQPVLSTNQFVVVLDAGHGGNDGGSTSAAVTRIEKDDNLRMALATKTALQAYPNVTVLMTRETDEYVTLEDRCKTANQAKADLFISLHRNCASEGNGVEIWINSDQDRLDKQLAEYIMELLESVGISRNRGIKYGFRGVEGASSDNDNGSYYVNSNTEMPSCLVELGFMTAPQDNTNFDTHCDAYAAAIARAIVEFGTDEGMYVSTSMLS